MSARAGARWHIADRRTWDCLRCGAAWPCEPARTRLLEQPWARGELGVRMATEMAHAITVLPPETEFYQRFLGWIRTGRAQRRRQATC